jgi:hypothetical protein
MMRSSALCLSATLWIDTHSKVMLCKYVTLLSTLVANLCPGFVDLVASVGGQMSLSSEYVFYIYTCAYVHEHASPPSFGWSLHHYGWPCTTKFGVCMHPIDVFMSSIMVAADCKQEESMQGSLPCGRVDGGHGTPCLPIRR